MKKRIELLFLCMAVVLSGCSSLANEDSNDEPASNLASPSRHLAIKYSSEYGKIPDEITNDSSIILTENELLPLHEDKKTFAGWYEKDTDILCMPNQEIVKDTVLYAKWRDVQVGDIVLAEGPIVSKDYFEAINKSIHPMAIIYKAGQEIYGISTEKYNGTWGAGWGAGNHNSMENLITGKESLSIIASENPEIDAKRFFLFDYAKEYYKQYFGKVQNCPYQDNWYIPACQELNEAYREFECINDTYSKLKNNASLLPLYNTANGIWTCNSKDNRIIAMGLVEWGNYSSVRRDVTDKNIYRGKNRNLFCYDFYESIEVIKGKDYHFFYYKMNLDNSLYGVCIREF